MSKKQFIIILGVWTIGFLFLGFPEILDKAFAVITGLLIIILAYRIHTVDNGDASKDRVYVENKKTETTISGATVSTSSAPVSNYESNNQDSK
jgi:small neutral amino acid transporter SnatA (MarC family)